MSSVSGHQAAGLGLTSAQVGSTAYFTVSPRDAYANQISGDALAWTALGGDVFKATLQLMENVGGGVGPHKVHFLRTQVLLQTSLY